MQIPWFFKKLNYRDLPWLRWLVILGVLGLSFLANNLTTRISPLYLIGGILGGVFGLVAMRNMPLALTIVLLTSATSGVVIGTGRATPLPAGLLMVAFLSAIWLIQKIMSEHRIALKPSPLNLPLLLFLISALISWIIGYTIWDWRLYVEKNLFIVQAGQYAIFLLSFIAMFLASHTDLSERTLKIWTMIVIVIGLGEIAAEIFLGVYRGRDLGITGSLMIFPIVFVAAHLLFDKSLKSWMYVVGAAAIVLWLYWAYRNLVWKGGWVPALFGLALLLLFRSWKFAFLGAVVAGIVGILKWDYLVSILYVPEVVGASSIRPLIWRDIAAMVLPRSPVFGLGLVNYMYYWNIPDLIPLSRVAAGWAKWNAWGYAIPAHNMFMDIFAQMGLVGLIFFVWGMCAALWVIYQVSKKLEPGFLRVYVIGVFCSFAAMLFGSFLFADWLMPFAYNITITGFRHSVYAWILLGSVLGLYHRKKSLSERVVDLEAEIN